MRHQKYARNEQQDEDHLTYRYPGMGGHYLPYPPSPFSLIGIFGLPAFAKMVLNYTWALALCLIHPTNPVTFEEDLDGRMSISGSQALATRIIQPARVPRETSRPRRANWSSWR